LSGKDSFPRPVLHVVLASFCPEAPLRVATQPSRHLSCGGFFELDREPLASESHLLPHASFFCLVALRTIYRFLKLTLPCCQSIVHLSPPNCSINIFGRHVPLQPSSACLGRSLRPGHRNWSFPKGLLHTPKGCNLPLSFVSLLRLGRHLCATWTPSIVESYG
jgi:hypothetical protein